MKQKKAIYVTLTLLILTIIENQLIWYGWSPIPIGGLGGLVLSGGLAVILAVVFAIQLIAYLATRKAPEKK